jgi:hypothetical protein
MNTEQRSSGPNEASKENPNENKQWTYPKFPLERETHDQMNQALKDHEMETGVKLKLSMFLRRTVKENWQVQLERFRKLHAGPKRDKA